MALVVLIGVMAGYNSMFSYVDSCSANPLPAVTAPPVTGGACPCCSPTACPVPCDPSNTAQSIQNDLSSHFEQLVKDMSNAVEGDGLPLPGIAYTVDTLVEAILEGMNNLELDMISWWKSMWTYNLKPSMQAQTRQINTANPDQVKTLQSAIDAAEQSQTLLQYQENETKAAETFKPSEQVCVAATSVGGLGRATEFAKNVRKAVQKQSRDKGGNLKGTPAAQGIAAAEKERYDDYENIFCDPNGGKNPCAGDANFYNADTQVTRQFYNNLTIKLDDTTNGPKIQAMVQGIINNMVGSGSGEVISQSSLKSAMGQETFIKRRSYLARHAAVRSVPQLMLGWRTPGSRMGPWVTQLRTDAGIPASAISQSPSYREIVHAMSVDRFNSGNYATKNIATESEMEKEKLMLSAFYLMQLRDYFELLERQTLVLLVQVSIMADQFDMTNPISAQPTK